MTRNLRLFAAFCVLWSVAFFYVLNWALYAPEERSLYILVAAITYGIGFGISGFLFGRADSARNSRLNLALVQFD